MSPNEIDTTSIRADMKIEVENVRLRVQVDRLLHALRDYIPPRLMREAQSVLAEAIDSADVVLISRMELKELERIRELLQLDSDTLTYTLSGKDRDRHLGLVRRGKGIDE